MAEVNLKNVQCERSNQKNEEDGCHDSKIEQRVIQRDSSPKRGKRKRQGKDIANFLLPNLVLHLNEERRDLRSQVKRSKGGDLVVRLHLHNLLIPRALSVRKKIKKPTGFILYQMKINLN